MTKTYTDRLKLLEESDDEYIDQFDYNWPILDKYADSLSVAPNVVPPDSDLFSGCIVAEQTTGKMWMAVPNPNVGSSAFVKSWLSYPWQIEVYKNFNLNTQANQHLGWDGVKASNCVNASAAYINAGSQLTLPMSAIYSLSATLFVPGVAGAGSRWVDFFLDLNGASMPNSETYRKGNPTTTERTALTYVATVSLKSTDLIGFLALKQEMPNATMNCTMRLIVTMLSPLWSETQ